jgi:hypothetical protein
MVELYFNLSVNDFHMQFDVNAAILKVAVKPTYNLLILGA